MSARGRREQAEQKTLEKVREHHEKRGRSPEEAQARAQATLERQQKEAKRATQQGEESVQRAGGSPQEQGEARSAGGTLLSKVGEAGAGLVRRTASRAGETLTKAAKGAAEVVGGAVDVLDKKGMPAVRRAGAQASEALARTADAAEEKAREVGKEWGGLAKGALEDAGQIIDDLHGKGIPAAREAGKALGEAADAAERQIREAIPVWKKRGKEVVAGAKEKTKEIGASLLKGAKELLQRGAEIVVDAYEGSRLRLHVDRFRAAWNGRKAERSRARAESARERLTEAHTLLADAKTEVQRLENSISAAEEAGTDKSSLQELLSAATARVAEHQATCRMHANTVERHNAAAKVLDRKRREIVVGMKNALEKHEGRFQEERGRIVGERNDLESQAERQEVLVSKLQDVAASCESRIEKSQGLWNAMRRRKIRAELATVNSGIEQAQGAIAEVRKNMDAIDRTIEKIDSRHERRFAAVRSVIEESDELQQQRQSERASTARDRSGTRTSRRAANENPLPQREARAELQVAEDRMREIERQLQEAQQARRALEDGAGAIADEDMRRGRARLDDTIARLEKALDDATRERDNLRRATAA